MQKHSVFVYGYLATQACLARNKCLTWQIQYLLPSRRKLFQFLHRWLLFRYVYFKSMNIYIQNFIIFNQKYTTFCVVRKIVVNAWHHGKSWYIFSIKLRPACCFRALESAIISRIRIYYKDDKNSKVKITKAAYLCHFSVRPIAEETSNLRFVRSTTWCTDAQPWNDGVWNAHHKTPKLATNGEEQGNEPYTSVIILSVSYNRPQCLSIFVQRWAARCVSKITKITKCKGPSWELFTPPDDVIQGQIRGARMDGSRGVRLYRGNTAVCQAQV